MAAEGGARFPAPRRANSANAPRSARIPPPGATSARIPPPGAEGRDPGRPGDPPPPGDVRGPRDADPGADGGRLRWRHAVVEHEHGADGAARAGRQAAAVIGAVEPQRLGEPGRAAAQVPH